MAKTQNILQPQYVQKFQCIGSACEDSCCCGWRIFIDKATYDMYRKCPDAKLRQKMNKKITRNRVNPDEINYAKVKMNTDASCPFWDDDKLCSIQRSVGEKYLSKTCREYPRQHNLVGDVLEKSITVSCPEAAYLALLNPNLMEFDMTVEDAHIHKSFANILDTDDAKKRHKPEQYFSELRVFTISMLQNRQYPLWQRLVILGLFYNKLNKIIDERKNNEILTLVQTYLEQVEKGMFHDILESTPNILSIQIEIVKELVACQAIGEGGGNSRFTECFVEAMKGINYSEEISSEELSVQFALTYENYYQPFVSKYEYILENYLVNYVFSSLFPFRSEPGVFDNYTILIIHYAMIKMLLVGMAGFHRENFGTGHMLKLIQSLTKVTTHNPVYLKSVVELLKQHNMDNMPYMAILIKN